MLLSTSSRQPARTIAVPYKGLRNAARSISARRMFRLHQDADTETSLFVTIARGNLAFHHLFGIGFQRIIDDLCPNDAGLPAQRGDKIIDMPVGGAIVSVEGIDLAADH